MSNFRKPHLKRFNFWNTVRTHIKWIFLTNPQISEVFLTHLKQKLNDNLSVL